MTSFFSTKRLQITLAALVCLLVTIPASSLNAQTVETTMTVDLLDRVALSMPVDGVVQTVAVRVGDTIGKNQRLVQLDTERLEKELQVAEQEFQALKVKSENNSRELTNIARERSARFNVEKLSETMNVYQLSVPELEMVRAESELEEASSEIKGARQELAQFRYEAEAKREEIELLKFDIEKSSLHSPYDGALVRVEKHPGEYVTKGETIAELYRLDRLSGVVLLSLKQVLPTQAVGMRGQFVLENDSVTQAYPVTVKRVMPRVDVDGKYRAFVEIENQQTSGRWRLLPGMVGVAKLELQPAHQPEQSEDHATLPPDDNS